jgi:hypothetical protein
VPSTAQAFALKRCLPNGILLETRAVVASMALFPFVIQSGKQQGTSFFVRRPSPRAKQNLPWKPARPRAELSILTRTKRYLPPGAVAKRFPLPTRLQSDRGLKEDGFESRPAGLKTGPPVLASAGNDLADALSREGRRRARFHRRDGQRAIRESRIATDRTSWCHHIAVRRTAKDESKLKRRCAEPRTGECMENRRRGRSYPATPNRPD